jgi:plasmid stabilization system protein ParE
MARVLKREGAKRDLAAQWVWYAENAGMNVADRFLRAADSTRNLLSTQPESGCFALPTQAGTTGFAPISDLGRFREDTSLLLPYSKRD